MKHELYTAADCKCDKTGGCNICDGGLALCMVCGGAEGSLPTECPGIRMTNQQEEEVYKKELDFVDGAWKVTIPIRT